MRVLLLNSNTRTDVLAAPPIGLSYVATATEAAGHEVRVLDLCFCRDRPGAVRDAIGAWRPEVVGISVRNLDNANLLWPASYVRDAAVLVQQVRELTTSPVVVGGSGASLCPEEALRALGADFVVVSDGERAFPALLACLDDRAAAGRIPGVGFLQGGQFHFSPPAYDGFTVLRPGLGKWVDDLVHAAEATRGTEFTIFWYFLAGGPGETNQTLQESLDFAERYLVGTPRPPSHMAHFFLGVRLYPRTALWDIAVREGVIREDSDPLEQLWYLSERLDLQEALWQLTTTADRFPGLCLGFEERYLVVSRLLRLAGSALRLQKPYWRHLSDLNRLLMRFGLRRLLRPRNLAPTLRAKMDGQRVGIPDVACPPIPRPDRSACR